MSVARNDHHRADPGLAVLLRHRSLHPVGAWISLLVLVGSLSIGCTGPKPFLLQGDASSAQVGYGGDVESATIIAKQHCAQFERVPYFLEAQENIAFFECVRP